MNLIYKTSQIIFSLENNILVLSLVCHLFASSSSPLH